MAEPNFIIERLNALPVTKKPGAFYITPNATNPDLVDLTFTNAAGDKAFHALNPADVETLITNARINATQIDGDVAAKTAETLATARAITLEGPVKGTGNFDGSGDLTITTTTEGLLTEGDLDVRVPELDANKMIPIKYLPTSLDNYEVVADFASLPAVGSNDTIYLTEDTNKIWRYTGSEIAPYVEISSAGMADEANKLATARDFSVSGDATATAVPFDGTGNVDLVLEITNVKGEVVTGPVAEATKLATAQDIALDGIVKGTASFDGSGGITITTTTESGNAGFTGTGVKVTTENGIVTAVESQITNDDIVSVDVSKITGDIVATGLSVTAEW